MKTQAAIPFGRITFSLAAAVSGLYVAAADDAPGAAGLGGLLMVVAVVFGAVAARNRLSPLAFRTAVTAGVVVAALAAFAIHHATVTAALFPGAQQVPSTVAAPPSPEYATAVGLARERVRIAIVDDNIPGVSVAVSVGNAVVWVEGFGWRDVASRAPVTPDTRFNIGTAAAAVATSVAPVGLTSSGTDPVERWSPSHLGEPEDDFPPFTLIRHVVFRPLGLAPDQPLPGNRATFYVPRSGNDPASGRREMYMRDMVCCANRTAFYSTPSDLVRLALTTETGHLDGRLAGGLVMSLVTQRDRGLSVAVTANIAHVDTSAIAAQVADAFMNATR